MEAKVLADLARKMGIDSSQVVKKAAEYSRLVSVQGSSLTRSLALSGSAKSVICLELATISYNIPVDKKTALHLSGMSTKKAYHHAYKTLECLLGRQKSYSVHDLAVQFGVLEAAKLAETVFQSYQEQFSKQVEVDLNKPVFPASALYAVCRMQKIRLDKTKLLDLLGVKKSQFDKLSQEMQKIASDKLSMKVTTHNSKRSLGLIDRINEAVEENCRSTKKQKTSEDKEGVQVDDYEEWKRRILEEAAKAQV